MPVSLNWYSFPRTEVDKYLRYNRYNQKTNAVINNFDRSLLAWFNQFSRHSESADKAIAFLSDHQLSKGGVLMALIWWAWFTGNESSRNRRHVITTLMCSIVGMATARVLTIILPFRARPIHQEGLDFIIPYGMSSGVLDGWSSFPSDHAVLFYTLSVGLLFVSKKVGAFAVVYTTLFVALPRLYLGLHYPTDLLAGAMLGATLSILGNLYLTQSRLVTSTLNVSSSRPALFYPLFFMLSYQLAELLGGLRQLAGPLHGIFTKIVG